MTRDIALDLGTTAIKAGVLSGKGVPGKLIIRAAPEMMSDTGRYESDALAYAATAEAALAECLAQTTVRPPLGLCSQRSSFLIWESATGRPVTPLISWQDNRGAQSCERLRDKEQVVRDLSGLPLTPYYLAPKLRVLLQDNPSWRRRLSDGEWRLGTLDTFLVWRWTGGRHYLTDASMAARTQLMDVHEQQWSPLLCELFDVPLQALPTICPSVGWNLQLDNGLVLQSCVSDQSAALLASIAIDEPEALVNLGTGGFIVRFLPEGCRAPDGYLQTLVWQESMGRACFAGEGTLNSIASALAPYAADVCRPEDLAQDGIFCLAEPSGLGAPYFRGDLGLMLSAPVDHLPARRIRALLLEGIIFRVARILEEMHHELGVERVYLSGGLSGLACLQQGIARCATFATIYRLQQAEASLAGAARLAACLPPGRVGLAEKIEAGGSMAELPGKYGRWKDWLDGLLGR